MSKLQRKVRKTNLILIIITLILILLNLILLAQRFANPYNSADSNLGKVTPGNKNSEDEIENISIPKNNDELAKMLSTKTERDRMEYYCGGFFKHIEKQEYDAAYNLLYSEFKQKYFPTVEEFEEYVKKTYPSNWALDYDDITRQGDIYVLRLKIYDVLGSKENEKVQRIVIRENNYNDFVMSFQVI